MNGQCIAVVSGKGGTGKTSLTAGVGTALALSGKRVLCVDCDIGLRNLDLALGLTDRALMDFSDVALNRCSLESAVDYLNIPKETDFHNAWSDAVYTAEIVKHLTEEDILIATNKNWTLA